MENNYSYKRSLAGSIDWWLIGCYVALVIIGLANIYSSIHASETASFLNPGSRCGKQLIWFGISLVMAGLIIFVFNPRLWEVIASPSYLVVLLLLIAVIFLGVQVKGSRSWFAFGPIRFQPAEVSKITTSLMLAMVMSQSSFKLSNFRDLLTAALIIGIPMLVIVGESETGSALVYVGFIFMLYREGLSGWYIFVLGLAILTFILTLVLSPLAAVGVIAGIVAILLAVYFKNNGNSFKTRRIAIRASLITLLAGAALAYSTNFIFNNILQDHQRKRIEVLLGLKEDPAGVGYNVNQSMIAIGSGGLTGKGYLNGTQTTYGFVPEQSTDFIFCTIGEEWGFIGSLILIGLYVFMIWRIIHDAEQSREGFTRIYGYCVACCIFMHLFINIGMTIGLMPVIGIPLPLVSYGGSSLLAFTILIFIFVALDRNEKKYF